MQIEHKLEEPQAQLQPILSQQLRAKLYCPVHNNPLAYVCLQPSCGQYICGKIECIDSHFHYQGNKLSLQKINLKEIAARLKHIETTQSLPRMIEPLLGQLEQLSLQLKNRTTDIFATYKDMQGVIQYLQKKEGSHLDYTYLQKLEELQQLYRSMEEQVTSIQQSIEWRNIWVNLENEFQITQRLKVHFKQFANLCFQNIQLDVSSLNYKEAFLDDCSQPCQGVLVLYFTSDGYVLGQFIANQNVQTCGLFLKPFYFVINQSGQVNRYAVSRRDSQGMGNHRQSEFDINENQQNRAIFSLQIRAGSLQQEGMIKQNIPSNFKIFRYLSLLCMS